MIPPVTPKVDAMPDTRTCTVCSQRFTFYRAPGRPPERCSTECRRIDARKRSRAYYRRLAAARDQLAALHSLAA